MSNFLSGYIECYVDSMVVKYEFTIIDDDFKKLVSDYTISSHNQSPLVIRCVKHNEPTNSRCLIIISGETLRQSALRLQGEVNFAF